MAKIRGFEVVADKHRVHKYSQPSVENDIRIDIDGKRYYVGEVQLPTRSDKRSAGYDFYAPTDVQILPNQQVVIFTDVKAYMLENEVLELYIRSSLATKYGLQLANNVGIVDASYYENPDNDGNIGIVICNTSGQSYTIKRGDRIAQGIFKNYLVADNDSSTSEDRTGGFGSSGR